MRVGGFRWGVGGEVAVSELYLVLRKLQARPRSTTVEVYIILGICPPGELCAFS